MLDDSSATGKKITEIYDGLGIALKDSEGQIRSTYDILADLAEQWDNLSKNEQEYIALTSAGSNQVQNFTALMENFSVAVEATATAYNSSGSASKENEKAMDTISKKLQLLRSEFEQLVLGDGGLESFGKGILDVGVNVLTLINDLGGLKTVLIALTGVIVTLKAESIATGISSIMKLVPTLITKVIDLTLAFSNARTSTLSLDQSLKAMGITASATQLALGGIFAILTAGIAIYSAYNQKQEELKQAALESVNAFSQYSDTVSSTLSQIQDESASRNGLISIIKSLDEAYNEESGKLKDINELRDEAIEKLHDEAVARAQATISSSTTQYEKAKQDLGEFTSFDIGYGSNVPVYNLLSSMGVKTDEEALEVLNDEIQKYVSLIKSGAELTTSQKTALASFEDAYATLSKDIEEQTALINGYEDALKVVGQSTEEWLIDQQALQGGLEQTASTYQYTDEEIQEYADDMGISFEEASEKLNGFTSNSEKTVKTLEELATAMESWNEVVDSIQSSYDVLSSAIEEYNTQGYYSTDTLQSLLALSPEYLAMIQEEGNQLSLNEEALRNKVIAQAEEAKQIAYNTAIARLNAVASGESAEATEASGNASNDSVAKHNANSSAILGEAKANVTLAASEARIRGGGAAEAEVTQILEDLNTQLETIDRWANNVGTSFEGSMGKASKSTSKATSAVKEQKSALDELKDKYSVVIDFILEQYDKQIDKIKDTKESQLDAIDDEIDALQAERDAREKYWDDQLGNLEKENTERERNIELQKKQQALALAQQSQVMILKGGKFVYSQDEGEVATAQQDLIETQEQQEYERQRERMEELRDAELEWYDERIKQKEAYRDYLEKYYDEQIEALEAEKDAVNEVLEQGTEDQQEYWNQMIAQLNSFVSEWNALVGSLKTPSTGGSVLTKAVARITAKSTGDNSVSAYASGKGSVGDSEIAVVGENPKYRELVIGSKLNNDQGTVMALKRGSGVVNAGATNTLASIFNALNGQSSNAQQVSNNSNRSTSITIGSISLPDVKDGKGFVDYLQNFSTDITQLSYARS